MPGTCIISGVELSDTIFTLMHPAFPEITWNISHIEQAAFCGQFGNPEEVFFSELAESPEIDKWKHVDKAKVLRFINLANVPVSCPDWSNGGIGRFSMCLIDTPVIAVILPNGSGFNAFPIDGNHRMLAREQLGYKSFHRFVVPPTLEGNYRVRMTEI